MEIGKKISQIRKEKKIKIDELVKLSGVPKGTLNKILTGITKDPQLETLKAIAKAMNCTLDDFDGDIKTETFSYKEKEIINKYRSVDETGKMIVEFILDAELKRITPPTIHESKITDFEEEKKKRELPYYTIKASAGNGNFLATNDYILIEVDEYVPQQANYALKVKGDSMEPKYHDGDIVYVKTQKSIENGEIGIFCIDDNVYIKKLKYVDGKYRLISLNPAYKPIEIKESNEFICFGKVLN